jgi:hypothetical protein
MLNTPDLDPRGARPMPLLAAADLQDNLMTASHDLDRLQALLAHACDELLQGFHGAVAQVRSFTERGGSHAEAPDLLDGVTRHLGSAITALQFQDMASQLIAHTHRRLRNCADRLAHETMGDDEDGCTIVEEAPPHPNPVTQDEMDAGSVELF